MLLAERDGTGNLLTFSVFGVVRRKEKDLTLSGLDNKKLKQLNPERIMNRHLSFSALEQKLKEGSKPRQLSSSR